MTAVFYDNEEPQLIKLELVESIRTGYKQYKMIHLLEQPGGTIQVTKGTALLDCKMQRY